MNTRLRTMQRARRRLLDRKLRPAKDMLILNMVDDTECLNACLDCIEAGKRDLALGWLDSQFHADGFEPTNRV